jgi:hypothetical protein
MLGNIYKMPKGVNYAQAETWLAGQKDNWQVDEVEVWSVRI